jgi:hypothetical protein
VYEYPADAVRARGWKDAACVDVGPADHPDPDPDPSASPFGPHGGTSPSPAPLPLPFVPGVRVPGVSVLPPLCVSASRFAFAFVFVLPLLKFVCVCACDTTALFAPAPGAAGTSAAGSRGGSASGEVTSGGRVAARARMRAGDEGEVGDVRVGEVDGVGVSAVGVGADGAGVGVVIVIVLVLIVLALALELELDGEDADVEDAEDPYPTAPSPRHVQLSRRVLQSLVQCCQYSGINEKRNKTRR